MKTFLILACLATCAFAVDYCSMPSCREKPHIGCQNDGALSGDCPSGSQEVELTPALIQTILDEHNNYRNIVAGGNLDRYEPALRMATIAWDYELAKLASWNVRRCLFEHDKCHNTEQFPQSGQNLYKCYANKPIADDITPFIKNGTNKWYVEHNVASMADIDVCPRHVAPIAHFLVMVADRNVKLGCAFMRMPPNPAQPKWHTLLMACNYAAANVRGYTMYESSTVPASGCKNTNPLYPNLCAVGETY